MSSWHSAALRGALFGSVAAIAVMGADAAWAQAKIFNIPTQPASSGVAALARQGDVQVLISAEDARGRRTNAVVGSYTVQQALGVLLADTGLRARSTGQETYIVVPHESSRAAPLEEESAVFLPEILVRGDVSWSLNTDIRRTEDDAQPYVVFTAEDIARSGSVSLDQFFRDFLGANNTASTSETTPQSRGKSQLNLRGLGVDETLILVDGRRLPNTNTGRGYLEQPTILGIPMAQIERIEVLPNSASSVYGGGATGGVINIILKRDYRGVELATTYADVFEGDAADVRADLSGGFNLEQGRTNISASLSYRDVNPLLQGDRDFIERGFEHLSTFNPDYFDQNLILGATPNIRSFSGALLTFDPAYGGGSLGSNHSYLPAGYRGVALDGVAALVANAGRYNLELAPTATGRSRYAELTSGQESISGSIAVRREFTSWLRLYGEAQAQRTDTLGLFTRVPSTITVAADAPNNPFQQAINVAVPQIGADAESLTRSETRRFLGGAILQLPFKWQANLDYTYNWSRFASTDAFPSPDLATIHGMQDGTLDVMRDLTVSPLTYGYLNGGFSGQRTPSLSTTKVYSLRLAGPVPFELPGGKPAASLLFEHTDIWIDDSVGMSNTALESAINYTPERSQATDSAYVELRAPIIGPRNNIPLVHSLELQVSARYDAYEGRGAVQNITCLFVLRPLTEAEMQTACPPGGVAPIEATASRSHLDPTYALRWQPSQDITFRGSYGTGYLPPYLHQLIRLNAPILSVNVRDPERGGELLGTELFPGFRILSSPDSYIGGNPDVKPEMSETVSFGTIVTPRWLPDFRLSVDWTRIDKTDVYFQPQMLLSPFVLTPNAQAAFEDFLRNHPERFVRGPASDGFPVGPITGIDASYANLSGARVESVDFTVDYRHGLWGGELALAANASWLRELSVQQSETSPTNDWAGVVNNLFQSGLNGSGGVSWKGTAQAIWSNDRLSFGWRARFFDDYYLNLERTPDTAQGTAKIPSQIYHDLFGAWAIRDDIDVRWAINNVLNRRPPVDVGTGTFYSRFGDPRLANFQVSLTKRF
jgi:outer membrane receptor protein involved in Fe transport